LYLIFYNSSFSHHLEFPYISVVHVDIILLCMFRINISLFAPIHNSLGLHIPYLNQRPVHHNVAGYIFLIFPLIFMPHYETRGIFPISPNSSLCVYRQTKLEQADILCLRPSPASFVGYVPNQFFLNSFLSLATKPTIWIFLSATHNSLPLYPLPSAQSYNNTILPDVIFYLSYVPYTASHSAVPFTAIFRIFLTPFLQISLA